MERKLTLVRGDDWEGLYIDGKVVTQDHRISKDELFKILSIEIDIKYVNDNWLFDEGNLPDRIEDVIWEDQEYESPYGSDDDIPSNP